MFEVASAMQSSQAMLPRLKSAVRNVRIWAMLIALIVLYLLYGLYTWFMRKLYGPCPDSECSGWMGGETTVVAHNHEGFTTLSRCCECGYPEEVFISHAEVEMLHEATRRGTSPY